jgi:hypothetical protein
MCLRNLKQSSFLQQIRVNLSPLALKIAIAFVLAYSRACTAHRRRVLDIMIFGLILAVCAVISLTAEAKPLSSFKSAEEAPILEKRHVERLSIALVPEGRQGLEYRLAKVSDWRSQSYGKYLDRDEANNLLQASAEAMSTVRQWLLESGVAEGDIEEDGQWLHTIVPPDTAIALLDTRISDREKNTRRETVQVVPAEVREHIGVVQRTPRSSTRHARRESDTPPAKSAAKFRNSDSTCAKEAPDLETCMVELTPACLRKLYAIDDNIRAEPSHPKSLLSIVGFNNVSDPLSHCQKSGKITLT